MIAKNVTEGTTSRTRPLFHVHRGTKTVEDSYPELVRLEVDTECRRRNDIEPVSTVHHL